MKHPVVVIALALLGSVFVFIGAAIFGLDHGVLNSMAEKAFARGLITYLFSVVTVGTGVVLVVSALTRDGAAQDEAFQRGKDIFALMLGLFGTIIGFYFGSEVAGAGRAADQGLRLTPPLLEESSVVGGADVTVFGAVSGGVPPYQYGLAVGADRSVQYNKSAGANGWIRETLSTEGMNEKGAVIVTMGVQDATGQTRETAARLTIQARPPESP